MRPVTTQKLLCCLLLCVSIGVKQMPPEGSSLGLISLRSLSVIEVIWEDGMLGGKGTKAWSSQTSGSLVVSCNKVPLIHPAKGKEHDGSLVWRHLHFIRKGTRERGRGGGGGGGEGGKMLYTQAILPPKPDVWCQKQQQPVRIQRQSFTFWSVSIPGAHWDMLFLLSCYVSTVNTSASLHKYF